MTDFVDIFFYFQSTLDEATIVDPKLVVDSVLDKTYMIQLVEVQNKRGAVGGETFVKAIEMQMPQVPDVEVAVEVGVKGRLPPLVRNAKSSANQKDVVELLTDVFEPGWHGDRNQQILNLIRVSLELFDFLGFLIGL